MTDIRYQVFVSSTYTDLEDERRAVIQTLVEMDCIPAGMELFPAADEEQFEFIKKVIDDCDYYLLIIANLYGSLAPDGLSYTEKEYDYAVSKGIKVIALIHGDPRKIPAEWSEETSEGRAKLEAFRDKVKQGRLVKFWTSADQLPGFVSLSVQKAMKMYPAVGWVRANKVADNTELLTELNEVRKQNQDLTTQLAKIQSESSPYQISDLAGLNEQTDLIVQLSSGYGGNPVLRQAPFTWGEIFRNIGPYLLDNPPEERIRSRAAEFVFPVFGGNYNTSVSEESFQTIKIQFIAMGLIIVAPPDRNGLLRATWSLTEKGKHLLMQLCTVRTKIPATPPDQGLDEPPDVEAEVLPSSDF